MTTEIWTYSPFNCHSKLPILGSQVKFFKNSSPDERFGTATEEGILCQDPIEGLVTVPYSALNRWRY